MAIHSNRSQEATLFSTRADYLLAIFSATVFYLLAIIKYGPGITNDSVNYLSAASTIEAGMKKADGTPFYEWPPLFPILLSIGRLTNNNLLTFAGIFHGLIYIANTCIAFRIIKQEVHNKIILTASLLLLTASITLLQTHIFIWSEPVFILLVLLNIGVLKRYSENPSVKNLILITILSILMYLQRKSGIYFIVSNSILLFYLSHKGNRWIHTISYLGIASLPVIWWYQRRIELSGKFFGSADWSASNVADVVQQFIQAFSSHFFPSAIPLFIRLLLLLIMVAGISYFIYKNSASLKSRKYLVLCGYSALSYYLLMTLSLFYIHLSEEIDDRILSPVYIPLLIFLMIIADHFWNTIINKILKITLSLLLVIWLCYPIGRTIYHLNRWNTTGTGGYNSSYWYANTIIQHLHTHEISSKTVFTNNVHALVYFINYRYPHSLKIKGQDSIINFTGKALQVCLTSQWNFPDEPCKLESWNQKEELFSTNDGTIWRVNKK